MREQRWKKCWRVAGCLLWVVALWGVAMTGCSDPDGEVACEAREDCPDGFLCSDGVCVEPDGEVDCTTEEDCPIGYLCHASGVCIEDEGEVSCESHGDCSEGRICEDEVCVIDPYGPIADEIPVEDEDYHASFYATARVEQVSSQVEVRSSDGQLSAAVDTGSVDCEEAWYCALSADMSQLFVVEVAGGGGYDISVAPVSGDPPAVSGAAELLAESVEAPRIRGNAVIFQRPGDSHYEAYYQEYDGQEIQVATLQSTGGQTLPRAWDVDPTSGLVVLYRPPDLERLEVYIGTIDEGIDTGTVITTLDPTDNYPRDAGSLYIGATPTAVSPDGRLLAFVTTGPNNHGACHNDGECTGTSQICGDANRCVVIEPTINVIDLEFADNLDEPCISHESCGPIHRCDSATADFDGGTCQPQRIIVGLPTMDQGNPSVGGCKATRDDGSFAFTRIRPPLSFGPDGRIYFVGYRDCVRTAADPDDDVEANIPRTSIAAGDPRTGEIEELYGNIDGNDYTALGCWDHVNEEVADPDECEVVIHSAWLSPGGHDLTFRATNPTVGHSLATTVFDVWRVRRDGENPYLMGQLSGAFNAEFVRVH